MKHSVKTYRDAGLEAKWTRNSRGAPTIVVRNPRAKHRHQRETWWVVTKSMFEIMEKEGVTEGFDRCTLIADIFSISD